MTALKKRDDRYIATEVDDELILLDMEGGELFSLTGTGREIWVAIDGTRDADAITAEVAGGYNGDKDAIESDVRTFLKELGAVGLVE
ncbi:PqqD family peptide modification chaperone [Altererythrobacter aurantiacus]|uniref:PqqD family peptide modification chaperone n=1 Tax=Parapontixanthobacter aurantiacus TaxID=1463599 RepID=A0A844ZFG2_9SPHN|nr:PqqD family protein [Parapontixanthobacter aurantiacus]MXO86053.1 PqqD family peptide modification chaperone [Parapontixanthobacter aurantiacus]